MKSLRIALGVAVSLATAAIRPAGAQQDQGHDGHAIYDKQCKSCHGATGTPPARARNQYKKIKAIGDEGFVSSLSQDSIVTLLQKGIDKDMKSFSSKLSESEMKAVAAYVKELADKSKKAGT